MATYFVASGGSNTSPYDTWAKAATSLATALAAATSAADVVVVQYNAVPSADAELSVDTTYTFAGNISLISASNDGGSSYTPTAMGTANWIGNSTTNRAVTFAGADRACYVYGITVRTAGTTTDNITLTTSAGQSTVYDSCYFWSGNTNTGAVINLGGSSVTSVRCINCTFRFGATGQNFVPATGSADLLGCTISSAGSAPTTLIESSSIGGIINMTGCDLSHCTGTLMGDSANFVDITLERCKLGSGLVLLASQTSNPNRASPRVWVSDCSSGDTHGLMGYYDALGSVTSNTSIYYTTGAAAQSWLVATTANTTVDAPFVTPWIDLYNTSTSLITPYIEILRDGSTTAYKDHEVWAEFSAKTTTTSTQATLYTDSASVLNRFTAGGSNQAAGAGTGSWTGEAASAWSGKCDSGSAFSPAENGAIRGRIVVTAASISDLYVDPQIRT